jgi:hypothetical protein
MKIARENSVIGDANMNVAGFVPDQLPRFDGLFHFMSKPQVRRHDLHSRWAAGEPSMNERQSVQRRGEQQGRKAPLR